MRSSVNGLSLQFPGSRFFRKVRRRAGLFLCGEHPASFFDLHDRELVNRVLAEGGLPPLTDEPIIAARDGRLARGESVYELRDDLRRAIPLALTPPQRGAYLRWFVRYGRHETAATVIDVLRALFEQDGTPDRGLVASYLVHPEWQAKCPGALAPAGWEAFKRWLAAEYRLSGRWLRKAVLPSSVAGLCEAGSSVAGLCEAGPTHPGSQTPAPEGTGLGANVIGLFRYPSGLQQAADSVVEALRRAGVATELRDVPMPHTRDERPRTGFLGLERFPVTVLSTGLDIPVADAYRIAGLHPRSGVYRVAVWWWELDRLPAEWLDRGRDVDEIWAPTEFIAGALRPLGRPVFLMPPSVELPAFDPLPKAAFGLDPRKFTFLFVFDMNSRMARKNPLGLIRAFRRAFRPEEAVELVIKVSPQEKHWPEQWRELRAAAAAAGVKLIDKALSRIELLGLMNAADAYVSLHRSEGFGLTMAEAMLLGKPTAATGYSGNLDFMTADNSYLIDCTPAPVAAPEMTAPPGAVWAEPSVEHAAAVMRSIYDRPGEARERGRRAQAELREKLSHRAAGVRMAARLRVILGGRR